MNSIWKPAYVSTLAIFTAGVVACGNEPPSTSHSASTNPTAPAEAPASLNASTVDTQADAKQQLLDEGFVVRDQVRPRDATAPHSVGLDILENPSTGELAYMSSDTTNRTPILVMNGDRVTRQLGETTPNYVGMTEDELRTNAPEGGDSTGSSRFHTEYGTNSYTCCVQTCVNNDLANIGCTGVGNLLPYCSQAAIIFSAGCAFSCINDDVSCAIAPNCGCGPVCGDGICDLANGENCSNCQQDCGPCGGGGGGGGGDDDDDDDDDDGCDVARVNGVSAYEDCVEDDARRGGTIATPAHKPTSAK